MNDDLKTIKRLERENADQAELIRAAARLFDKYRSFAMQLAFHDANQLNGVLGANEAVSKWYDRADPYLSDMRINKRGENE